MTAYDGQTTGWSNVAIDSLDRFVGLLVSIVKLVTVVIAFFIAGAIIFAVFLRFVLNTSLLWTDELTALLLACMMFLVIGIGLHERMHIGVSAVVDRLPPRGRTAIDIFVHLVSTAFFALIGVEGYWVAQSSMTIDLAMVPLPRGLFHLAMPIGAGFAVLVCLNKVVQVATGRETPYSRDVE